MKRQNKLANQSDSKKITPKEVLKELNSLNFECNRKQIHKLTLYLQTLILWNKKTNLVGLADWKKIFHRLIIDSLYLKNFLKKLSLPEDPLILDIGAGAGLPGIPLRIFWPYGRYIMIESRQRKSTFLLHIISTLDLKKTFVKTQRSENLFQKPYRADLVLSRGFCPWEKFLSNHASYLLKKDGFGLVFSNNSWENSSEKPPENWSFLRQEKYPVKTNNLRYFWIFCPNKDSS